MITETLLNMFFSVVDRLLGLLPFMDYTLPMGAIDSFLSILDFSAYFLPMNTIVLLLSCIIAEEMIKIFLALIKLIWKFIPVLGA